MEAIQDGIEAIREQQAHDSLCKFVEFVDVPGAPVIDDDGEETERFYPERVKPAQHHRLIIEQLEKIERGDLKRLMIFMPPGSAKSTYASVVFPVWYMGRNRRKNIICASYGADLARKFGRKCRTLAKSKEYQAVFETTTRGDNAAVDNWSLDNGSEYMASGILGSITGNRADGLVIDDPIKGREDADSVVIRDKTWEAYKSDLRTRLKPGGFIVFILTRWHEDDPAGRILPENYNGETGWITARDGEQWYVLSLQAECERADDPLGREPGEFIWPEWFPAAMFEQEKLTQGPRNWAALYQQRPAPEDGDFFKREWIKWYDFDPAKPNNGAPLHLSMHGASDYAVTSGGGDWTVHGVAGVDPNDDLYLLDWWRDQSSSDVWIESLLDLGKRWEPREWAEESGQIAKSLGPYIDKRQRETSTYFYRKQFPSAADKATRAQAIRGRLAQGKVYFPKGAPWVEPLVSEMMRFTGASGDVDDQVDVLSLFGRMLAEMGRGRVPNPTETKRPKIVIGGRSTMTIDQAYALEPKQSERI